MKHVIAIKDKHKVMLATCSRYGETFEFDYHYIISILLCLH